ncbi:DUF4013 domain-containing protein [Halorubrum sp. GN11_10-6_MGM]|uniref:DUF4013 domain-containing protein n=1 Tax=Halorubrum sp. GN11_10-6_MGM TaxID=2518112 RepID=UPI0010F7B890|nr:DUF4013 domain-containing protein [Halorubrum sp. GN11_10-6_MGM]TKX75971.1 DUF4013 domain-containing protein [Halorubrum sp. GN11_10-6_MGM]
MRPSIAAVTYPIAGDAAERPLLAVWLLLALSVVVPVLPAVPVVGYLVRVLVASERGDSIPEFLADGRTLVRRSLGGLVVCLVFLGVPFAALLVTLYGIVSLEPGANAPVGRILAGSTAVLLVGILGTYLAPISLTTYGREGSLRRAFSPAALRPVAGHAAYFFGWTLGFTALVVTAGVGGALFTVSRAGPLFGTFVLAYGLLVTAYLWGRAVERAKRR